MTTFITVVANICGTQGDGSCVRSFAVSYILLEPGLAARLFHNFHTYMIIDM